MRVHLFVTIALLAACSDRAGDKPADKPAAPAVAIEPMKTTATVSFNGRKRPDKPTGAPRPQKQLTVTLDGAPVEMATALAWKDRDGRIKVTASSVPVGCDEVTGNGRWLHDGEVTFDVAIAYMLQPDGSTAPQLHSTYYAGSTIQHPKPTVVTGDGTPGQPVTVDVDFATTNAGKPEHTLTVKGTLDALGCAVAPSADAPALPPEMPATMTIAGKVFPIRFAKFSKIGDWPSIELYAGAASCKQPFGDVSVQLTWFKPDVAAVSQVSLGGALVPASSDQTFDKSKLVVNRVPTGAGEIELKGDIEVMHYPLQLDGKVTVVECPK